jgi:hypothetical protein
LLSIGFLLVALALQPFRAPGVLTLSGFHLKRSDTMKAILSLAAIFAVVATPLMARDDSFSEPAARHDVRHDAPAARGPGPGLYDRISGHYGPMGRDVRENFRDGPCKISREWEKNGDYYERISCKGPRRN